jgi:hypothetical protein
MILTGETGVLGEKHVPVSLCRQQNVTRTGLESSPGLYGEGHATIRLSHMQSDGSYKNARYTNVALISTPHPPPKKKIHFPLWAYLTYHPS